MSTFGLGTAQRSGLRRAFWLGMVAAHAPAWLAACGALQASTGGLLRWTFLTLSLLFFALKLLDVRWLRPPAGRPAWLAMTLAIALLHAGVVQRMVASDALPTDVAQALPQGATVTVALVGLAWGLGRLSERRRQVSDRRLAAIARPARASFSPDFLPPRYLLLARACLISRAPPR